MRWRAVCSNTIVDGAEGQDRRAQRLAAHQVEGAHLPSANHGQGAPVRREGQARGTRCFVIGGAGGSPNASAASRRSWTPSAGDRPQHARSATRTARTSPTGVARRRRIRLGSARRCRRPARPSRAWRPHAGPSRRRRHPEPTQATRPSADGDRGVLLGPYRGSWTGTGSVRVARRWWFVTSQVVTFSLLHTDDPASPS